MLDIVHSPSFLDWLAFSSSVHYLIHLPTSLVQGLAGPKGEQGDAGLESIKGAPGPAGLKGQKGVAVSNTSLWLICSGCNVHRHFMCGVVHAVLCTWTNMNARGIATCTSCYEVFLLLTQVSPGAPGPHGPKGVIGSAVSSLSHTCAHTYTHAHIHTDAHMHTHTHTYTLRCLLSHQHALFCASLGYQGDQGPQGAPGVPGSAGAKGMAGDRGFPGQPGSDGDRVSVGERSVKDGPTLDALNPFYGVVTMSMVSLLLGSTWRPRNSGRCRQTWTTGELPALADPPPPHGVNPPPLWAPPTLGQRR